MIGTSVVKELKLKDYETNEAVKNFFDLALQKFLIPLINRTTRITRTTAAAIDHILTDSYSENDIYL